MNDFITIKAIIPHIITFILSVLVSIIATRYASYFERKNNIPYIKAGFVYKKELKEKKSKLYYRINPLNYNAPVPLKEKDISDDDIALKFVLRKNSEKILTLKSFTFKKLQPANSFVNVDKDFKYSNDVLEKDIIFIVGYEYFPISIEAVYINKSIKYIISGKGNYFGKYTN